MNPTKYSRSDQLRKPVCTQCVLKEFSVFHGCSGELLEDTFSHKQLMEFGKDEILVSQGEPFRGVFCIQKGVVKVLKDGSGSKKMILWFAKPGDIIGLDSFVDHDDYSFSAVSVEPVTACFIPEKDFQKLIDKEPGITRKLMKEMCEKINYIEERITSISGKNIREQFAEILISIAVKNKNYVSGNLPINYSIKDLANIIGTTNNYLYKILSDLNNGNVVSIQNKKLVIKDFDKLSLIAIGDETVA